MKNYIGKKPVYYPSNIKILILQNPGFSVILLTGPKGSYHLTHSDTFKIKIAPEYFQVIPVKKYNPSSYGLVRTKLVNLVKAVTTGHRLRLRIRGVGYKFQLQGNTLQVFAGFKDPVSFLIPEIITIKLVNSNCILGYSLSKDDLTQFIHRVLLVHPAKDSRCKGLYL